ncbi:hypothetical protein [Chitinophaga sp. CF418]|uniref:hypothetical protein n=1 Tax=Chitinophaga sp. CF418 TaxID=1855287 RepID=UPI000923E292|nr:hypothetical protein [Chitinophaga sp. CF418]SHN40847.1 hypothetical protein SAMN05216311_112121 [Chitinophaga sp. CF418]
MNNYLSQIAVRASGGTQPHSLTPVQRPQGLFTPRQMDTGNDMAGPLVPSVAASPVKPEMGERLLPEQPLPLQQQIQRDVPEQQEKTHNRMLYLERFLERSTANVQTNSNYTVIANTPLVAKPPVMNSMPATIGETTGNTGRRSDIIQPVVMPQQLPGPEVMPKQQPGPEKPSQIFAVRPGTPEKEVKQHIQPATQQTDTAVTVQPPAFVTALRQPITALAPRGNAETPVPQAKKAALPKVTIGRITVEVVPPPAVPVQTVPRNRQRSPGSPIPAPGSDEIHKLSFGFGQL